jgi:hypothetical protein
MGLKQLACPKDQLRDSSDQSLCLGSQKCGRVCVTSSICSQPGVCTLNHGTWDGQ